MTTSQLDEGAAPISSDRALVDAALRDASRIAAGSSSLASLGVISHPPPDQFPGYDIVEEIHRGAQGVVYRAVQHRTQRQVAIKVLRGGPFAGRHAHRRFDREIQILARLKHPNIVTIHDSGVTGDCLYYIMDYIPGRPPNEYAKASRLSVPDILALFAKICRAVNAAHLHGVIHRDLKPGNIRVDDAGEPHVLDFGLAKTTSLGAPSLPGVGDGSEREGPHDLPTTPSITETGQFIGSLPWASPEQAEGLDSVDLRTDVYSLGVILYQMLTAKFPYPTTRNTREMLAAIANTDPLPPSKAVCPQTEPARPRPRFFPFVPSCLRAPVPSSEVDTIALKCLAKDPARRYQSAGELAQDIERFLVGEPIEAKRDSAAYVLRKQLRKHKLPVAVAVAFVLVVTVGLAGSLTFWQQSVAKGIVAEQRRVEAETERTRAEANFQKARDAVDQMLSEVGHKDLADVPLMEPVRKALLERALGFYQDFLKAQSDDPPLMFETALAYKRVADIHGLLGSNEKSDEHYQQAAALFDRLAAQIEQLPDQRERLARVLTHIAQIRTTLHQDQQAEQTYIRALAVWEALAAAEPAKPDFARRVAARHWDLGVLMARNSRSDQALTEYRTALRLYQNLAAEFPAEPDYAFEIAVCHNNMGQALFGVGRYAEVLEAVRNAVDGFAKLAAAYPDQDTYRVELSRTQANQGSVFHSLERYDEAEEVLRASAQLREKLAADFPHRPMYRQKHANSLNRLASLFQVTDRPDQAEQTHRRVLQLQQDLVQQFPGVAEFEHMLGGTLHNLAMLLARRGDAGDEAGEYVEAISMLERAIDHQNRAIELNPHEPWYRQFLHNHYMVLFNVLEKLDRLAEAGVAARRALRISRKLAAEFPDQIRYRADVAADLYNLGNRLRKSERWQESEAACREAIALYQELAEQSPDVPEYRRNAALAQGNLDAVIKAAGRSDDE